MVSRSVESRSAMLRADRWCPRCKAERAWRKERPPGARASRRSCLVCGWATRRIKGRRTRNTMPSGFYEHRQLKIEADKLWSRAVLAKIQDGRCFRCRIVRPLQAAHNVSRRVLATRHDLDNGLPLCAGCHRLVDCDAEEKRALFLTALGSGRYERLQLMKQAGGKVDLKLVILSLGG